MKKLLLTVLCCVVTTSGFACWQTFEIATKTLSEDDKVKVLEKEKGKFYLACDHTGAGTSIYGANIKDKTMVFVRKVNNKIDVKVSIFDSIFKSEGDIYLTFLDSEGFEIDTTFISKVGPSYFGNLYRSYEGDWNDFYRVYSYELHLRG